MYTIKHLDKQQIKARLPELERIAATSDYSHVKFLKINTLFVASAAGKVVGFGGLACYHGYWCFRICIVSPEHRGNGLQRQLIRTRLRWLKGRAKHVNVWVKPTNVWSLNNLIEEGFRFVSAPPRLFEGVEHIKMRRDI